MFEVGKKYKIKDVDGVYYTALITEEAPTHISFIDLNGEKQGLKIEQIAKWKQIEYSKGSEF